MGFNELNADAKYLPGQDPENMTRKSGGEFGLALKRFQLTEQSTSESFNQERIWNEIEAKASGAELLNVQEQRRSFYDANIEDGAGTTTTQDITQFDLSQYQNIKPSEQDKPEAITLDVGEAKDIDLQHIEQVQREIVKLDKEIAKVDGFVDNLALMGGTMAGALTDPAVLLTLPLGTTAAGMAGFGSSVASKIGMNAAYAAVEEMGITAISEVFIQSEVYQYNQKYAAPELGIKQMDIWDAAGNIAFATIGAGVLRGAGSAAIDYNKFKWNPTQFKVSEDLASYQRSGGADTAQLTKMLEDITFDRKVDPSYVSELKKIIDTSPSADIDLHMANTNAAAKAINEKGFTDFASDDISTPIKEAVVGDKVGIGSGEESFIADVLKQDENSITIKLGDDEVKIDRLTGESANAEVFEAPLDIKTLPQQDNVNKVDVIETQRTGTTPEPQSTQNTLIEKYADDVDVVEIDKKLTDIENILGLEPEVKPEVKIEPLKQEPKQTLDQIKQSEEYQILKDAVGGTREKMRESNPEFNARMDELSGDEDATAAAQAARSRGEDIDRSQTELPSLTKTELKAIENGTAGDEVLAKLDNDLELIKNEYLSDPAADQAKMLKEIEDAKISELDTKELQDEAATLFAKGGPELLGGGIAGIEQDEEGNITVDPLLFLAGLLAGNTLKRVKSKDIGKALDAMATKITKKYPMLDTRSFMADPLEQLFLKNGKVIEEKISKDAKQLPKPFQSFNEFKKGRSEVIKTPYKDIKVDLQGAYQHLTENTHNADRTAFSGAFFDILEDPLFVVEKPYKKGKNTIFYKPYKTENENINLIGITLNEKGKLVSKTFYDISKTKLTNLIKLPDENLKYFNTTSFTDELAGNSKKSGSTTTDIIAQGNN